MRRALGLLLALLLFAGLMAPAIAEVPVGEPPALYAARLLTATQLMSAPSGAGEVLANLKQNAPVDILKVEPDWLHVRTQSSGNGYIQRKALNYTKVTTLDPRNTPMYPAILASYLGWTARETPVLDAPNGATLVTLQAGARLAFVGFEDGWAKLVYNRQYAYVDTRHLSELQPLFADVDSADGSAPIAAYTSFYRTTTDSVNLSRMVNIRVGCERMERLIIEPQGRFDFNAQIGPYNKQSGYEPAYVLVDGQSVLGYGGGTCQVSSTLYNTLMQLPGLYIAARRPHGPGGAKYLPLHADAAVGNKSLNLVFENLYPFPVRIDGTSQDGALTIAIYRAD